MMEPIKIGSTSEPRAGQWNVLSGTDRLEVPAIELPTTPGAVRDLLGVGFAYFQIVEIHPLVCASDPPELSPDFVLFPARTTQRDHRHIPFSVSSGTL